MDSGFIIGVTIAAFVYLSSQTPNMLLRHVLRLFSLLIMLAAGAVVYLVDHSADPAKAAEIWAYSIALSVLAVLSVWIISWLASFIHKEGNLENEKDL